MTDNPLDPDETLRICREATPGPWDYWLWAEHMPRAGLPSSFGVAENADTECDGDTIADFCESTYDGRDKQLKADAAFIAHAREALPAACELIKQLQAKLEEMGEEVEKAWEEAHSIGWNEREEEDNNCYAFTFWDDSDAKRRRDEILRGN